MQKSLIDVRGVFKSFGQRMILNDISLSVNAGEMVSIVGKSGTGKSTLLNVLALLDTFDRGQYFLNGELITNNKRSIAKIRNEMFGFIFQSYNLLNGISVEKNILMPLQYVNKELAQQNLLRYEEIVDTLNIRSLLKQNAENLSGGEKQRVAIARAIINNPKIVFADEPTGNLDEYTRNLVLNLFHSINDKYGVAMVVVTHDEFVASSTSKCFVIRDGGLHEKN